MFPPRIDKQTPIPLGIATAMPVIKPIGSPLTLISLVGHSCAARLVNPAQMPIKHPITTHPSKASVSFTNETRTSGQSIKRK